MLRVQKGNPVDAITQRETGATDSRDTGTAHKTVSPGVPAGPEAAEGTDVAEETVMEDESMTRRRLLQEQLQNLPRAERRRIERRQAEERMGKKVIICDKKHPHYGETGVLTGKVIQVFSKKMGEVILDNCKHGTSGCFVEPGQIRELCV